MMRNRRQNEWRLTKGYSFARWTAGPYPTRGIETMLTLNNPLFDLILFTILFWQTNLSD